MSQPWGRLYSGTRHHRKIRILRQRCPESWWVFYPLLEMAFETDDGGLIYIDPDLPFPLPDLAAEVGIASIDDLEKTLEVMAELKLISREGNFIQFLSYSDRQFKSDSSAERTRKYRENLKKGSLQHPSDGVVTSLQHPSDGVVTPPDTDTETETETEINTPPNPPEGGVALEVLKNSKTQPEQTGINGVVPYLKIQDSWNRNAPPLLPRVKVLDDKRRRLIKAAWQEHPEVSWFDGFFRDIALSDHHSGKNDRGWVPDITWVLKDRVRLQEKFDSLKQALPPQEVGRSPCRDPACPQCRGHGLYQSDTTTDGKPITTTCYGPKEVRDGPKATPATTTRATQLHAAV